MSILLGILSVVFIALAGLDKRFYFGLIFCLICFVLLMIMNDNKFLDFTYFFFAIISNENGECKENQYILYNPFSTFPISKNILYEGIYFSLLPKILSTS